MKHKHNKKLSNLGHTNLWVLALTIFFIAISYVVIIKWVAIEDWWKLRGYNPPTSVVTLANQDTMTSYTRHLFYLNKPQLLSTVSSFRVDCPENSDTIVLGCYHSGQNGIFIYNVADPTLAGISQVTAAHEVLHAVYERLSVTQRSTLDSELENYFTHDLTNTEVKAEVAIYQKTEPNSVYDEMSCTFGTEIASLPTDLNNYYSKYFSNRQAIVDYENQYEGAFISRQNTINQDDTNLANMKATIDTDIANLQSQETSLDALESQLVNESDSNVIAYNAGIPVYNKEADQYNASVSQVQALIGQYNQLVNARIR